MANFVGDSADIQSKIDEVTKEIIGVGAQVQKTEAAVGEATQNRNAARATLRNIAKQLKRSDLSEQARAELVEEQQSCMADLKTAELDLERLSMKEAQLRKDKEQLRMKEEQLRKEKQDASAAGLGPGSASGAGDQHDMQWQEVMSPSRADQTAMQEGPHPMVVNWRPASNSTLPPELAFPAFGTFLDTLSKPPTQEDVLAAFKFCKMGSTLFPKESDLESAAQHYLAEHIGMCFEKVSVRPDRGRAQTDGAILIRDQDEAAAMHRLVALMEVKNVGGSGDSSFQGACYYGVFWGTRPGSPYKQSTCCPALLLEVVGPTLRVSALYWARTVVIRPLTSMMNLLWMADNEAYMLSVAQVLAATKAAVTELAAFYRQPPPARPPATPRGVALLPYPLLESNGRVRYSNAVPEPVGRFVYRADARRARRSTSSITSSGSEGAGTSTSCASSASDSSSERVVVRFARRYGADAHRAWAAAGLAPALHAVRPLAGGWLLLEMELLSKEAGWVNLAKLVVAAADAAVAAAAAAARDGASGGGATAAAAAAAAGGRDGASWAAADGAMPAVAALQRAVASVRAALDRAHAVQSAGRGRGPGRALVFAHGDMRPQNIMVRPQEGDGAGLGAGGGSDESSTADAGGGGGGGGGGYDVRFLDFEFAGAVGAARYPPFLNMDVAWPAGVEFNAPVLPEHDTALLSASIEQLWLRAASRSGGAPQPQPPPSRWLLQWRPQWQGAKTAAFAAAAAAAGAAAADGAGVEARDSGSAPSASRRGNRRRGQQQQRGLPPASSTANASVATRKPPDPAGQSSPANRSAPPGPPAAGDAGPAAAAGTGDRGRGRPRGRKGPQQQQGGPAAGGGMGGGDRGRGGRGPKPPACFCVRATAATAATAVPARALMGRLVARPLRAAVWL
ncbi:hypothetical protein HXX76_009653 [Chlamydomonas incerta]|uniref:Aminoglycoside phosphotransferase domain-containing protein n=1 Tax=Chlamydomonas incerta TaxID=51695 RepID=A0A835SQ25_CHLIN|nr:hypothetical protein HXX76_009653 [Chlamydomonas incerta]|eukprot:KAG2431123.1 hypothetical protein HXX76_009653 [Chlamydomonas incerta]